LRTEDILKYYTNNKEQIRAQNQQLEFLICEKVLNLYLKDKSDLKILELGAGSGHYTELLAQKGHEITVVEPVKVLNELNQKNLKSKKLDKNVEWIEADARNLKLTKSYDLILNMGPMYHLFESQEREQLMRNLKKHLDVQGLLMSVFLSRVGFVSYLLSQQPESLFSDLDGFRDIVTTGHNPQHPQDGSFRGYFTNLKELGDLHTQTDFQILQIHVLDPCIGGRDETFNRLSVEQKAMWSDVLLALSSDPNFWNSGRTWMAVATHSV
jgi:SAM-dependent methyltransferase